MTDPVRPDPPSVADGTGPAPWGRSARDLADDQARRQQIEADLAHTVLEAAARRLAEAVAEYEAGLDRRVLMLELQFLDREAASAQREFDLADRRHALVGCRHPDHARSPGGR